MARRQTLFDRTRQKGRRAIQNGPLWRLFPVAGRSRALKTCPKSVRRRKKRGSGCGVRRTLVGRARRRNRQVFAPLFIAIGPSGKSAKRGFDPLKFAPVSNVLWLAAQGQSLRGGRCLALAASFETAGKYPRITGFSERHCGRGACDAAQSKAGCPPLRYGLGAIFSFRAA